MWDHCILGGARSPFTVWRHGRRPDDGRGGALKDVDVFDLGALVVRGALDRCGVAPEAVSALTFGNVYPTDPYAVYGGRYVSLRAGLPEATPALTANMACGSGLYAVLAGARELEHGSPIVVAGGTDVISRIPKDFIFQSFEDRALGGPIGKAVEALAAERGIGRDEQDRFALLSHQKAAAAEASGKTAEEIVPAAGASRDDAVRPAGTADDFARAKPLFGPKGSITRENTHALVDGASALVLATAEAARNAPRKPLGRLRAAAYSGVPAREMGRASVPAIRKLLSEAGLSISDIDLFEINETFAAQMLVDMRELGLPEDRVNVNGGALAIGHPFAGTGGRQLLSLLLELRRRQARWGVASICVAGGQGIAVLVEAER